MFDSFLLPAGVGQVGSRIRWLVLSRSLERIGEVHPVKTVTITNDTSANIFRSARGVVLRQNDLRELNPNTDRLMPVWEFEDGSRRPGYSGWPLGVFMFGSRLRDRGTLHSMHETTLMDQGYQLDQEMSKSFGVPAHADVYSKLVELLHYGGITQVEIPPFDQRVRDPINWPIGTRLVQIVRDLCKLGGVYPIWLDNVGQARTREPGNLDANDAIDYELDTPASRVIRGRIRENERLLDAPNVYVVVSNGPTSAEISARAYIDARLPHSMENIGYERPKVIRMQGLADILHAQRIADVLAQTDTSQYMVAEFESTPDPRHDTFDTVRYDGVLYVENRWSLVVAPGGAHIHTCTRGPYDSDPAA